MKELYMTSPKISIIIPVYNAEKYLAQCLDSMWKQTEKHIEVIAVDDGSKDKSLEILKREEAKHSQLKVYQIENSGPGAARQHGLNHASGKYIMFCDADDYYLPEMCEKMLKAMEMTKADWGICDAIIENHSVKSDVKAKELFFFKKYTDKDIPDSGKVLWCHILRKRIIDKYHITFPVFYYGEDISFIIKYVCASRSYFYLKEQIYFHTDNDTSIMAKIKSIENTEKLIDSIQVYFEVAEFLKKYRFWNKQQKYFYARLESALIVIINCLQKSQIKKLLVLLYKFLENEKITPNFEILSAIQKKKLKKLLKLVKTTNIQRTRRIKICGLSLIKIKNKTYDKIIYLLGIPIRKKHYE